MWGLPCIEPAPLSLPFRSSTMSVQEVSDLMVPPTARMGRAAERPKIQRLSSFRAVCYEIHIPSGARGVAKWVPDSLHSNGKHAKNRSYVKMCARDRYPWQQPRHGSSAAGTGAGCSIPLHDARHCTGAPLSSTETRRRGTTDSKETTPTHTERCVCASQLLCLPTSITGTHTAKSHIQKLPGLLYYIYT